MFVASLQDLKATESVDVGGYEQSVCQYVGADFATVVRDGNTAMQLAYAALGLHCGDGIVASPISGDAAVNAARVLGCEVCFADVLPEGGNLSVASVASMVGPNTKAIVVHSFGGMPADLQELRNIADRYNLWLIEDATEALGASYRGQLVNAQLADLTIYSLPAHTGNLKCGPGAIVTNNNLLKERLDRLRQGVKSPLPFLDRFDASEHERKLRSRRAAAARYRCLLSSQLAGLVSCQRQYDDRQSAYSLFPVFIDFDLHGLRRERVMTELERHHVATQVHYLPLNWNPYHQKRYGHQLPQAGVHQFYQRTLSLPMYSGISDEEVDYVVDGLARVLHQALSKL